MGEGTPGHEVLLEPTSASPGSKSSPLQRGNFSLRVSSAVDRRKMATYVELQIEDCRVTYVQTGPSRGRDCCGWTSVDPHAAGCVGTARYRGGTSAQAALSS